MGLQQHDLTAEGWRKLNAERDPWRILAIGSEATAWWIHVRSNPHVAAEMVMGTHELCRRLNPDIASLWLRSLVITSHWTDLLTQSFFLSWLERTAPDLLPPPDQDPELQKAVAALPDFETIAVDAQSAAEFSQACAAVLEDLRRWEVQDNRLDRNVGGFNVLQALNMSRWKTRHDTGESSLVFNAAAFGLEFVPNNPERYGGSFLRTVLDGEVVVHTVTLGTRPNRG
jgi:hypothetical protein